MSAAGGIVCVLLAVAVFSPFRIPLAGVSPWMVALVDLAIVCVPLVAAVLLAVGLTGSAAAGALGIRSWIVGDVVLGAGLGLALRAITELSTPTTGDLVGPLDHGSIAPAQVVTVGVTVAGAIVVSPVVEELFFRGLILRATYGLAAEAGRIVAAGAAILVSTGAFVCLHALLIGGSMSAGVLVATIGVGLGCAITTILTGRLVAAIVAHVLFNAIGVALLLV